MCLESIIVGEEMMPDFSGIFKICQGLLLRHAIFFFRGRRNEVVLPFLCFDKAE